LVKGSTSFAAAILKVCCNQATRCRLRAERRAGELLKDLQKAVGARKDIQRRANVDQRLTKKEQIERAGLTEKQAKTFERLASVPKEIFDAELKHSPRPTCSLWLRVGSAERRLWRVDSTDYGLVAMRNPHSLAVRSVTQYLLLGT
jgi:hypothetical protein